MNVPGAPMLRAADFPTTDPRLLDTLSRALRHMRDPVAQQDERAVVGGTFITAPSGVSSVTVKNPLARVPKHITLAIRRDDLANFSAAWSWWFRLVGDSVKVSFVGLPASVTLVYSMELT